MNITVLFNPLKGRLFPMNHHFLVSYSHRANPFPSRSAIFPLQLNSLRFPPTIPFCGPSFSPLSPHFFCQLLRKHLFRDSSCRSSLPQLLPLKGVSLLAWLPQRGPALTARGRSHRCAQQPPARVASIAPAWHGACALLLPSRGFFPRPAAAKNAVEETQSSLR